MQRRHYGGVLRRWAWLIVLGTVLCAGATYVLSKRAPLVYDAVALLQVNDGASSASGSVFTAQALAVSDALLVTAPAVFAQVAQEGRGTSVDALAAAVSAAPLDNTPLIAVRAAAPRAAQAAALANAVARAFLRQQFARASALDQRVVGQLGRLLAGAKVAMEGDQASLTRLQAAGAPPAQLAQQTTLLSSATLVYTTLLNSYTQAQLQASGAETAVTLAQTAVPPTSATGRRVGLDTALAAALGLLLSLSAALLLDALDTRLRTPADVARATGLAPLGSVPLVSGAGPAADAALAAAFVTISTTVRVLRGGRRTLLVSGLRAGAGSATTAAWLARGLAQAGLRVLLVEAPLGAAPLGAAPRPRRTPHAPGPLLPPPAEGLRAAREPNGAHGPGEPAGLSAREEPPLGTAAWLQQWRTDEPQLFVRPAEAAGESALGGAAQLARLSAALAAPREASGGIDLLLIDAPALEAGGASVALAAVSEGTVLVIEAGRERAEALTTAQATLERLGAPILGVVLTRQRSPYRGAFDAAVPPVPPVPPVRPAAAPPVPPVPPAAAPGQSLPDHSVPDHNVPDRSGTPPPAVPTYQG